MATLATDKAWSRLITPPRRVFRELTLRGSRMAFISLIGVPVSLLASGLAYMLYGSLAGMLASVVMVLATEFVSIWSLFYGSTQDLPPERDIALAGTMIAWIGLSHSERVRRLDQIRKSDIEIDERVLRMLETELRELRETHGNC